VHAIKNPKPVDDFGFCQWYKTSNSTPTGFNIISSGLKWIYKQMKQKATEQEEDKRVRVPGLPEFIVVIDSEASDAESPHFEDVAGAEVSHDIPGRVGTALMEEVEIEEEEEEEEEENSDVHFKQKRKGKPHRKRMMKKPHRHTPVITESESVAVVPPPAPLVIKLSAQKKASEKAALDLGKISSCL